MKKIRNIIVLTLVACLYACQGETEFSTIQNDVKQNTNVIPIDEAISSLYEFLSETNTRSKGEMPQIAESTFFLDANEKHLQDAFHYL